MFKNTRPRTPNDIAEQERPRALGRGNGGGRGRGNVGGGTRRRRRRRGRGRQGERRSARVSAQSNGPQAEEEAAPSGEEEPHRHGNPYRGADEQLNVVHADAVSDAQITIGSQICVVPRTVPNYPDLSNQYGQIQLIVKAALGVEGTVYSANAISFADQLYIDANDQNVAGIEYVVSNISCVVYNSIVVAALSNTTALYPLLTARRHRSI